MWIIYFPNSACSRNISVIRGLLHCDTTLLEEASSRNTVKPRCNNTPEKNTVVERLSLCRELTLSSCATEFMLFLPIELSKFVCPCIEVYCITRDWLCTTKKVALRQLHWLEGGTLCEILMLMEEKKTCENFKNTMRPRFNVTLHTKEKYRCREYIIISKEKALLSVPTKFTLLTCLLNSE